MTVTYCVLCDIDLLKLNVKTFLAFRQETKTEVWQRKSASENGAAPFSTGQDSFGGFISKTEPVVFIAGYRFHWSNAK